MAPTNIDFTTLTHVIHFALVPNADGSLNSTVDSLNGPVACAELVGLAHGAGRKALVCVGGADTETVFLGATTSANLGTFVTNIVTFMSGVGYDGVDLDWEPFNSSDTAQYTNLVNALRTALDGFGTHKMLTVAARLAVTGLASTAPCTMLASVQGQLDQINIMTYDMSGPWEGWVTWFNSPIYDGGYTFPSVPTELVPSINGAVTNYVNEGVQPGKIGHRAAFLRFRLDRRTGGDGTAARLAGQQCRRPSPPSPTRTSSTSTTKATSIIGTTSRKPPT